MQTLAEYIAENRDYVGDESLAVLEGLTEAQWPAICAAAKLVEGGSEDPEPGLSGSLTKTHETFADFADAWQNHWREAGTCKVVSGTLVHYSKVQMLKGQMRRDFAIVDLGDYRVVVQAGA